MNMKKIYFIGLILGIIMIIQCSTPIKVEYKLPPGIPEQNKEHVLNYLNRGSSLYKSNCSKCHGIYSKGRDTIPNFTNTQVESYKARFNLSHPQSHAFTEKMLSEDLDAIFYFLNNRKLQK